MMESGSGLPYSLIESLKEGTERKTQRRRLRISFENTLFDYLKRMDDNKTDWIGHAWVDLGINQGRDRFLTFFSCCSFRKNIFISCDYCEPQSATLGYQRMFGLVKIILHLTPVGVLLIVRCFGLVRHMQQANELLTLGNNTVLHDGLVMFSKIG
jgi:hypothetical protein